MTLYKDDDPAYSVMHGLKLLELLGLPKDMYIDKANIDIITGDLIRLNVTFILKVSDLKKMGVDLNSLET